MFYFSRLFVAAIAPLTFSILLVFGALVLLLFRKGRGATWFLILALTILLFSGYGIGIRENILSKEQQFPALNPPQLKSLLKTNPNIGYIVVLGSGHVSDPKLPVTAQIGGSSLYRLIEGIRLLQYIPNAQLLISGGVGYDPVPNAEVVADVATSLGVAKEKIVLEKKTRDTLQEAELIFQVVKKEPFILITSALHMPRAMDIFRSHGMQPIAAPTDFIIKQSIVEPPSSLFPTTGNIDHSTRILYEWLGTILKKMKMVYTKIDKL